MFEKLKNKIMSKWGFSVEYTPKPIKTEITDIHNKVYAFGEGTGTPYYKVVVIDDNPAAVMVYIHEDPQKKILIGGYVFYRQNLIHIAHQYPPTDVRKVIKDD